jgi:protein TonB
MLMLAQIKRELAAMPVPIRASGRPTEAAAREEKRRHLVEAAGRDRAPRQRGKRAPQEALHQPLHARGGLRGLRTTRCCAASRTAAPENFPELAGKKLYGELTMMVTVNFDGRVLATEVDESSGNITLDRRAQAIAQRPVPSASFTDAMRRSRPTRSWWSRASSSRATTRWKLKLTSR